MQPVLKLDNLAVSFQKGAKPAVRGVSLQLRGGEIVGLVGESGSGKSISALSIMGLLPPAACLDGGTIFFRDLDLTALVPVERRKLCGRHLGMVFQEPLTALNPVLTVGEQLAEIYSYRQGQKRRSAEKLAVEMLAKVGLPNPEQAANGYPHHFSGGMRQRVVIAMALALSPEIIIADEPTTALDPTIAAQILELLSRLAIESGSAVLLITHNLYLLKGLATKVLVMYTGLVVEEAIIPDVFQNAAHPYTQGLLKALPPALDQLVSGRLKAIEGSPPVPGQWPGGCPFQPRCDRAMPVCVHNLPPMFDLGGGRQARCFLYSGESC